ncbi:MAG: hypothetical protein Q4C72_02605 [Eubacteriales bacterium]|nr:hypothetical protein [Eubacteriales bacterium]
MRKSTALGFALCGTLLVVLLFIAGRMLYINYHVQSFEKIAGREIQRTLVLTENETELQTVTDEGQITAYTELFGSYTYTEYPHFFKPRDSELTANLLTVTFQNGHSISVNADGYVFVNGKLRDIEGGRGQEFYHKLYLLFYPNAV